MIVRYDLELSSSSLKSVRLYSIMFGVKNCGSCMLLSSGHVAVHVTLECGTQHQTWSNQAMLSGGA